MAEFQSLADQLFTSVLEKGIVPLGVSWDNSTERLFEVSAGNKLEITVEDNPRVSINGELGHHFPDNKIRQYNAAIFSIPGGGYSVGVIEGTRLRSTKNNGFFINEHVEDERYLTQASKEIYPTKSHAQLASITLAEAMSNVDGEHGIDDLRYDEQIGQWRLKEDGQIVSTNFYRKARFYREIGKPNTEVKGLLAETGTDQMIVPYEYEPGKYIDLWAVGATVFDQVAGYQHQEGDDGSILMEQQLRDEVLGAPLIPGSNITPRRLLEVILGSKKYLAYNQVEKKLLSEPNYDELVIKPWVADDGRVCTEMYVNVGNNWIFQVSFEMVLNEVTSNRQSITMKLKFPKASIFDRRSETTNSGLADTRESIEISGGVNGFEYSQNYYQVTETMRDKYEMDEGIALIHKGLQIRYQFNKGPVVMKNIEREI